MSTIPPFSLLETILYEPDRGFFLLERHLQRLSESCAYFCVATERRWFITSPNKDALQEALLRAVHEQHPAAATQPARVRLLWSPAGEATIQVIPLPHSSSTTTFEQLESLPVVLDIQPAAQPSAFLAHKTTQRDIYTEARRRTVEQSDVAAPFDVILWNSAGYITETSIANILVEDVAEDGTHRWITPPTNGDLLPGTMRAQWLAEGRVVEQPIHKQDLLQAVKTGRRIACLNSVRRCYPVHLVNTSLE